MSLSRKSAKRLADLVLAQASFGDLRVHISSARKGHLRYADGRPTTSGDVEGVTLSVTASKDGRSATVTGSRTDEAAVAVLVRRAEGLAGLSPKNPEHMPALAESKPPKVKAEDRQVSGLTAERRASLVEKALLQAEGDKVKVAGLLSHKHSTSVVANRSGLFLHHTRTQASFSSTCRTEDGTGSARAGYVSHALRGLVPEDLVRDAAERSKRSQLPMRRDPGRYTVILTAQAVADLMGFFVDALAARRADEGRSVFSRKGGGNRIGEKMFDERIHLWSDPTVAGNPAAPFDGGGRAHPRVDWVSEGILRSLTAGRYWANKQGIASIPTPSSLHMDGGTDDLSALIAGADRAVLVSRFWYTRMLDPQQMLITGLTRDGTFWVDKGKIVEPIRNFRFNDSPLTLLRKVVALGRPERAGLTARRVTVVPPMVVSDFGFSSISDAV